MTTCKRCRGRGYTKNEAPTIENQGTKKKPKLVTTQLGSGCPSCHGTGVFKK